MGQGEQIERQAEKQTLRNSLPANLKSGLALALATLGDSGY